MKIIMQYCGIGNILKPCKNLIFSMIVGVKLRLIWKGEKLR